MSVIKKYQARARAVAASTTSDTEAAQESESAGDDLLVLDLDSKQCFALNETAAFIWRLLETPKSLEEIAQELHRTYDVGPLKAQTAVASLLDELLSQGLIDELTKDDGAP